MLVLNTKGIIDAYGNKKLLVPDLQRDYVWSELECGQFWNDLLNTEINARKDSNAQHFMGILTLKRTGEYFELLDGQQRLTTVAVLLDYLQRVNQNIPTITFQKWNVVQSAQEMRGSENEKSVYARLFNFFAKQRGISGITAEKCAEILLNRFYWCVVIKDEEENSNQIFEDLNATGLPLLWTDLILSHLMNEGSTLDTFERKQFRDRWEKLLHSIYQGNVIGEELYETEMELIEDEDGFVFDEEYEEETYLERMRDSDIKPLKFKQFLNHLNRVTLPYHQYYYENVASFELILQRLWDFVYPNSTPYTSDAALALLEEWCEYYLVLLDPKIGIQTKYIFASGEDCIAFCEESWFGKELYYYSIIHENNSMPMLMRVLWKYRNEEYTRELVKNILGAVNRFLLLVNVYYERNNSEQRDALERCRFLDELVDVYIKSKGSEPDMKDIFALIYPSVEVDGDVLTQKIKELEYDSRYSKLLLCLEYDEENPERPIWWLEGLPNYDPDNKSTFIAGNFEVEHIVPRSCTESTAYFDDIASINRLVNMILLEKTLNIQAGDNLPEDKSTFYIKSKLIHYYMGNQAFDIAESYRIDALTKRIREYLGRAVSGNKSPKFPLEESRILWQMHRVNSVFVKTQRSNFVQEATNEYPQVWISSGKIEVRPENLKGNNALQSIIWEDSQTKQLMSINDGSLVQKMIETFLQQCRTNGLWEYLIDCLRDGDTGNKKLIDWAGYENRKDMRGSAVKKDRTMMKNGNIEDGFVKHDEGVVFNTDFVGSEVENRLSILYQRIQEQKQVPFMLCIQQTRAIYQWIQGTLQECNYVNIGDHKAYEEFVAKQLQQSKGTNSAVYPVGSDFLKMHVMPYLSIEEHRFDYLMQLRLIIPEYQRRYVWGKLQFEKILDDLQSEDSPCIGTIILQEHEDGSYAVVDGRQRLTTLMMAAGIVEHTIYRGIAEDKLEKSMEFWLQYNSQLQEKASRARFQVIRISKEAPKNMQYDVFSSINGKGKKLTFSEKIRNYLFSKNVNSTKATKDAILQISSSDRFIKAFLERHTAEHIEETAMYERFKTYYETTGDSAFKKLSESVKRFEEIIAPKKKKSSYSLLRMYNSLGVTTADALLLAAFESSEGDEKALVEFLEKLMMLYFLLYIMDRNGNAKKSINAKLPQLVNQALKEFKAMSTVKGKTLDLLNGNIIANGDIAEDVWESLCAIEIGNKSIAVGRFVLMMLEWFLEPDEFSIFLENNELERLQIEHIWPASKTTGALCVHKLENLCLLEGSINGSIKDIHLLEGDARSKLRHAVAKGNDATEASKRYVTEKGAKNHIYGDSNLYMPQMFYCKNERGELTYKASYVDRDGCYISKQRMEDLKRLILDDNGRFKALLKALFS